MLEKHNITSAQDISVQLPDLESERKRILIKIKNEPMDPEELLDVQAKNVVNEDMDEIQANSNENHYPANEDGLQEKKVPPLRVKLTVSTSPTSQATLGTVSEPSLSPDHTHLQVNKSAKDLYNCVNCKFKSNNSYIFGRHRKSCNKKRKLSEKECGNAEISDFDIANTDESNQYEDGEECEENSPTLMHDPEDSIEVPVEFDGDEESINSLSIMTKQSILDVHMDVVASTDNSTDTSKHGDTTEHFEDSNVDADENEDSHCSEDGEELDIDQEEEMNEDEDQPGSFEEMHYGHVSGDQEHESDSDNDNPQSNTEDECLQDHESLQKDADAKNLQPCKENFKFANNSTDNHMDEESSLTEK